MNILDRNKKQFSTVSILFFALQILSLSFIVAVESDHTFSLEFEHGQEHLVFLHETEVPPNPAGIYSIDRSDLNHEFHLVKLQAVSSKKKVEAFNGTGKAAQLVQKIEVNSRDEHLYCAIRYDRQPPPPLLLMPTVLRV